MLSFRFFYVFCCDANFLMYFYVKRFRHLICCIIQQMTEDISLKNANIFHCEKCDFKCSKSSNFDKHLATRKHQTTKYNDKEQTKTQTQTYKCECSKVYNHRASLFNHKKKCTYEPQPELEPDPEPEPEPESEPEPELAPMPIKKHKLYEKEDILDVLMKENLDFKNIILEVVKNNAELQKQNHDFQKQMFDLYKSNNTTNIQHNNSHNKTFNLQFFLNEKCKDAMNIMDFVNSMTLELEDLEEVGKLGYVEGISNIIIRKLNALDIYKRPIHCSDGKREIMFVKDDNIWEKENSTYDKLRKAIKSVTYKNSALLIPWREKYPNCLNNEHHLNDVYVQMLGQAMGGKESFMESENKIMKKIAKAVLIEKN